MSKVFVVQQDKHKDFTPALQWGELDFILRRSFFPDDVDEYVISSLEMIDTKMQEFNPEEDYILLAGDLAVVMFLGMYLGVHHDKIRVLKWDGKFNGYYPIELDLSHPNADVVNLFSDESV